MSRAVVDGGSCVEEHARRDESAEPTVLVVDDEQPLADAYEQWIRDTCSTRVAYDGEEAIRLLDESVDLALLDRQMPGRSGDEVAETIRQRDIDCRIAMLSALEPDEELLDVYYDTYRMKPLTSPEELHDLFETLQRRATYNPEERRLLAVVTKKHDIEQSVDRSTLRQSARYSELTDELDALRRNLSRAEELLEKEGLSEHV
ncbi:response regulator transcription factor [Haloarcula nitratireducens]|uniref:Response regulator n=1 Tax=Haloarcula nitratireducens TaxID=2487749 RepID=A0AAW4PB08_9EURY|nr:response regulator [Halomicroarcula nitratireducens]MBX0295054.1 response regulator [Halomicroarcula nitratireducens]